MQFHYIASDSDGRITEGDIEAANPAEVLGWMAQQNLKPVSVKAIERTGKRRGLFKTSQKIEIEDKIFLTKYLALMLRVGTDLLSAIDILIADFDNEAMKALLLEMKDSLSKGQPFYTTFERHPKQFSPVFVNLVKAGESSGNLDKTFERLSSDLGKQWELRNKIKGSLIYPVILVGLSLAVLFMMITFALPRIAEVFATGAFDPPLFSQIVFTVGLFFRDYLFFILTFLAVGGYGFSHFIRKTVPGRNFISRVLNKMPAIRDVLFKIALQRFASIFASLLRSGTPIIEALETTAGAVGSRNLKVALTRIAREGVSKGLTIGEAFKREAFFPKTVTSLIAVSEHTGHMEEVLEELSDFYESEIDASIKNLVSFLEPILLMIIGTVVGAIALAVIIPVYQLVTQI